MKRELLRFCRKLTCFFSYELASRIMYRAIMKKSMNIKVPVSFNEKIQYLKLKEYKNSQLAADCADKYAVRKYIESKGLGQYLNELYYVWDSVEEIDWGKLPDSFVLKCNHGCAYNIICPDKNKLDIEDAKKKLKKWMKEDFSLVTAEPHYKLIERKIICEKYLASKIVDYKIFCFGGVPKFLYISQGTMHVDLKVSFFELDGTPAPFRRMDYEPLEGNFELPEKFDEMLGIAKILSEDFKFARIDLFSVDSKIYFSEITLTPSSGMMPLSPEEYDRKLGDMIEL